MELFRSDKRIWAVLLIVGCCVGFHSSAFAASETEDLKAQIQTLNDRIAVLENQLDQKRGLSSLGVDPAFGINSDSWDPFREMLMMRQRMNRMFNDTFDSSLNGVPSGFLAPQTDIKAEDGRYVVTLDIPGMDKDTIDVEIKNGSLIVSGKRSAEKENKGDHFYSQERSFGQFMRTMPLPVDAKSDQVQARYNKGVLEVVIERDKNIKPGVSGSRKIKVK